MQVLLYPVIQSTAQAAGVGAMIWCKNSNRIFRHEAGTTVNGRNNNQPLMECTDYGPGVFAASSDDQRCASAIGYEVSLTDSNLTECLGNTTTTVNQDPKWCLIQGTTFEKKVDCSAIAPDDIALKLDNCAGGSSGPLDIQTHTACKTVFYPTTENDDIRTAEYVWCKNNNDPNKISKIPGPTCPQNTSQVTGDQLAALTGCARDNENIDLSVPGGGCFGVAAQITGTPGQQVATSIAEANLNQIKCDLSGLETAPLTTDENAVFSLDFGSSPYADVDDILASRSRSSSRSRRADDDFDDLDLSGTRDFTESRLLVFCEAQGTEEWHKFKKGKMNSEAEPIWDPSWHYFYRKKLLGLDGTGNNPTDPKYISKVESDKRFTSDEIKFINRCKNPKAPEGQTTEQKHEKHKAFTESIQAKAETSGNPKLKAIKEKFKAYAVAGLEAMADHRKNLERCEALMSLTKHSDYDREYTSTGSEAKTIKASFDQQLKCETYGPEAQDFKPCVDFINTYDASMVAKTALQAGQGIHYQSERIEDQNSLSQQGAIGGIDHRGALNIQKGEIKDRAGYANQNAALDTAKLAALFGILESMPNRNKLIKTCKTDISGDKVSTRISLSHSKAATKFLATLGFAQSPFTYGQVSGDTIGNALEQDLDPNTTRILVSADQGEKLCEVTAKNTSAGSLIMNDEFRDTAKRILAQTATEAAASFLAAGMLNKQARQIDDLLKRIEGYDPSENFVPPSDALLAGPCAFDPSTPGCAAGVQPVARNVGFGNNSLSIGGGGFGGNGIALDADTGFDNAATDGNVTSDRTGETGPIGSIIPNRNKSGGIEGGGPSAAGFKSSNRGGVSGGGGSGASAVGSTGRGGSGSGGAGGSKGGQASGGKSLAYSGSSIGRLSGGRGVGRKPASKDGGSNPFANMFKKGGPQNDTLNFRNPAGIGSKSGSIFDRISDRYKVVQSKNLLLEYEEKK